MAVHELKTWPEHFWDVWEGKKKVELRKDDREFQVGDTLVLHEWSPVLEDYTMFVQKVTVTHILRGRPWLTDGYVAMSIRKG